MALRLALRSLTARALDFDQVEPLQRLLVRCASYFRAADGRPPDVNAAMERIAEAAGDERIELVGFVREEQLVGMLELRRDEPARREATIVLLLVDPALRKRGLGREIVEALVDALRRQRMTSLHLGVRDDDESAHAFWQHLGFRSAGVEGGVTNYELRLG